MRIETGCGASDMDADRRPIDSVMLADVVRPDIVKTLAYPFRLTVLTPDTVAISRPGRARQHADGIWDIVDPRMDGSACAGDAVRRDMIHHGLAAAALGARHVVETRDAIGSSIFRANLERLAIYRTIVPTHSQQAIAQRMLASRSGLTLGDLADALHPHPSNGFTIAFGLVIGRFVSVDMETVLGRDSLISPTPPVPVRLPGLFDRLRMPRAA
ncbi:hypothetical protein IFT82_19170 [Sphingomonas sp. CFBP 8760]|nr:hypothetical protein [Sphingomonas sp. CFBP 8760]